MVRALGWLSLSLSSGLAMVGCKDLPAQITIDGGRDGSSDAGADRGESGVIRDANLPGDLPAPPFDMAADAPPADGPESPPPDGPEPTPVPAVGVWDNATWDESTWAE